MGQVPIERRTKLLIAVLSAKTEKSLLPTALMETQVQNSYQALRSNCGMIERICKGKSRLTDRLQPAVYNLNAISECRRL